MARRKLTASQRKAQKELLEKKPWLGKTKPEPEKHFIENHSCYICWQDAPFGYPGDRWYCREHYPRNWKKGQSLPA